MNPEDYCVMPLIYTDYLYFELTGKLPDINQFMIDSLIGLA